MYLRAGVAQSLQQLATSWTVRGSNPGWGGRFFASVQTAPGAHQAPCTMCTGSFLWVKRPGRGVHHPPPSSAEVKGVKLYFYPPSGLSWPLLG